MHVGDVGYVCDVRNVGEVDHGYAIEAASVPGIKGIMWTHGKPSDGAKAEARTMSESNKEDKRRRPYRTVVNINRSRPPAPGIAIIKPPPVMVRGPSPRLIRHPSPAVVGFIYPASRLVRRQRRFLIGLPNIAITRDINPATMLIKIVHAGVIAIGMAPALCVAHYVVAIAIPAVPIVPPRRAADFIFRLIRASDGNHLTRPHARASLRSSNFRFAFPHNHISLGI